MGSQCLHKGKATSLACTFIWCFAAEPLICVDAFLLVSKAGKASAMLAKEACSTAGFPSLRAELSLWPPHMLLVLCHLRCFALQIQLWCCNYLAHVFAVCRVPKWSSHSQGCCKAARVHILKPSLGLALFVCLLSLKGMAYGI